MRRTLALTASALLLVAATITPSRAALLSKTYMFKPGVTLEIAADVGEGLRLDAVEFQLPSSLGKRLFRSGGQLRAEVQLSNTGAGARRFGIAIALLDDEGRLLAVASGGSKFLALRADHQSSYTLVFDNVNGEAYKATTFKISVEPKP